jgi:hypothetical protein
MNLQLRSIRFQRGRSSNVVWNPHGNGFDSRLGHPVFTSRSTILAHMTHKFLADPLLGGLILGVARRPDRRTPAVQDKGVTIRLYRHRGGWKSTYQLLHGHSRRECYGPTQAAAQKAAEGVIFRELDPVDFAEGKDEPLACNAGG